MIEDRRSLAAPPVLELAQKIAIDWCSGIHRYDPLPLQNDIVGIPRWCPTGSVR
jgi:hypothetical protein